MDDDKELERDYVARLQRAQESGDKTPVPPIDESRVRVGEIITVERVSGKAFGLLSASLRHFRNRCDGHMGAVRD